MGGCYAKDNSSMINSNNNSSAAPRDYKFGNDIRVESIHRYDEQITNIIRRDFVENPQIFILNNVLMGIQFFENYQKELNGVQKCGCFRDIFKLVNSTTSKMEKELNRTLLKDETMECTSPDIIFDQVNRNVRYRPLHGPKKYHSEPLVAKRLYVINDTIEVVNSMDVPQYTSIDKPACQVRTEESRRKRIFTSQTNRHKPFFDTANIHTYDYTTITDIRTPKLLNIISNPERRDTIPNSCFALKKVKKNIADVYVENEDIDSETEFSEEDFFETVSYIDSKGFMNYFKNALFPHSLGRALGFDELAISEAKSIPGKIFCNLSDEDDNPIPCEIIPSVAIDWPGEQTFEFIMREDRPTITDRRTGYRYRWPTDEMLKEIKSLSCVLIPKGYWLKKGSYQDANIEWEIAFPKAERYIETRMSHSQMRCFLFLLTIHKTYIEPVSYQHGLLPEHIRCHMYWECESNYRDWPEHRLGTKLTKIIANLISNLSKGILPDYFIKQKNLFENIPKKYLQFAQKVFHDILQSPAMYFIKALRNLRYTSAKFYPPLDFKELYKILTHTQGIKIINPDILSVIPPNLKKKRYHDTETQWRHIQELKTKEKIFKQKQMEKENLKIEERKDSNDSVDLGWSCEKQFDVYKTKALLELFINDFIDIAKKSCRIGTKDQTLFYLKQAWYLTRILEDTASAFIVEGRKFKEIIAREEETCKKMAVKELSHVPPTTPVRNSAQFEFTLHQQVKSNVVNLNNLHTAFNSNAPPQTMQKIKNIDKYKGPEAIGGVTRKSVAFIEPNK
ncbi:hypothetical protein NQ317_012188 [Molorchus minor]|uniref:Mab-21-like HhH/H2TH-like domain-containing protein n=1 Tax=Molorchus minor TaxID=1323400 RepID=A0ABQ9K5Q2_9CUCU|nr:hypothetical protein NQ317_012188 [Molorchus minor]